MRFRTVLLLALALLVPTVASGASALAVRQAPAPAMLSDWAWKNPLPTGNAGHALSFSSLSTGWVAGVRGVIVRTTDAGANWTVVSSGQTGGDDLDAIDVVQTSSLRGIAAGEGGALLRTTDGSTWRRPSSTAHGVEVDYRGVFVAPDDPNRAWVIGMTTSGFGPVTPVMAKTTDGGVTWRAQALPAELAYATRIGGTSSTNLWVLSASNVWLSGNGSSWTVRRGLQPDLPEISISRLEMADSQVGYALGDASGGGLVYRTGDGGSSWATETVDGPVDLLDLEVIPGMAWARSGDGKLFRVTGSQPDTWTAVGTDRTAVYRDFEMLSSSSGFLLGDPGEWARATNDSGATFSPTRIGAVTRERLWAVDFADPLHGWAAGPRGTMLHTSDGGVSWAHQALPVDRSFEDVCFVDASRGWAVCDSTEGDYVVGTTDGGSTWNELASDRGGTAVSFWDAQNGWMAGQNGRVYATSDGGSSWTTQTTGTFEALWDIDFTSATRGWACGSGDTLLKTVDAGVTWSRVVVPLSGGSLESVDFIDANRGWIVDSFGGVYRTTNGGVSWERFSSGARGLMGVRFLADGRTGWAAGYVFRDRTTSCMTVLSTVDGGATWSIPTLAGYYDPSLAGQLWGIDAVAGGSVIAVGDGGAILASKRVAKPRAVLSVPYVASPQRVNRTFRVSGTLTPGHAGGSGTKLEFSRRLANGTYRVVYPLRTAVQKPGVGERGSYYLDGRLPYRTRWRVRAIHEDAYHAKTVTGYRYFDVR
ncbi:MAG: YCF48-related protein [Coriobacteriia bacterium]|nr:YCF48-related protein [Coriobacteriia bacterium]